MWHQHLQKKTDCSQRATLPQGKMRAWPQSTLPLQGHGRPCLQGCYKTALCTWSSFFLRAGVDCVFCAYSTNTCCLFEFWENFVMCRSLDWKGLYLDIMITNNKISPGCCGSVHWVPACEPKGCWFDSQSGHIPGVWARSPVGGAWEATTHWWFSPFLPPFPSL